MRGATAEQATCAGLAAAAVAGQWLAGALWPVWGAIAATAVIVVGLWTWGAFARGRRVTRSHRREHPVRLAATCEQA